MDENRASRERGGTMPTPPTVDLYEQAQQAVLHIRQRSSLQPIVGVVLGTGLGGFGRQVQHATAIPYAEIPHFPRSSIAGHPGNLLLGAVAGTPVAVLQGRAHLYEGHTVAEVTLPTRVLSLLGCKTLIVTNASGGINASFRAGDLVSIADHINLTGVNAAAGPNEPRFAAIPQAGQRFFDMGEAYSPRLRTLARQKAAEVGFDLPEGIYLAVLGPSFETPAEIRAFRSLGADLVGMSTVHEVIVARHMGLEVLGLSLVTNPAAGVSPEPIDHHEVLDIGRRAEGRLTELLTAILAACSAAPNPRRQP